MRTIQEIFDRIYNRSIDKGYTHSRAVEEAVEWIDDLADSRDAERREWLAAHPQYKEVYDRLHRELLEAIDNREVRKYKENSALKYHAVGQPFTVTYSDGVRRKVVAVERNKDVACCHKCIFRKFEGLAPNGYGFMYGCSFDRCGKNGNCCGQIYLKSGNTAQVREDNKSVYYKYV